MKYKKCLCSKKETYDFVLVEIDVADFAPGRRLAAGQVGFAYCRVGHVPLPPS